MGMGLQWAICTVCGVSKPLQKTGAMCIHVDGDSVRCPGSGVRTAPMPLAAERPAKNGRVKYKRNEITPPETLSTEMEAAFASVKRNGRLEPDPVEKKPLDRRIYAVKGARFVGGGLPTLGRGR